jgi:hypothetical protein
VIEEVVSGIWADVLGLEKEPGREASFFELGGHSLLATQVVSRLKSVFGVDVTLPMLFEAPTVSGLSSRIEGLRPGSAPAPEIVRVEGRGREALSYAQQRLWFLDQLHPGNPFYNINTAVALKGELDVEALEGALRELVERHEALRTRFPVVDGEAVQEVLESCELELERVEADGKAEARRVIEEAARRSFDLSTGPLMRALLVRVGEEEHVLLLSLHHIVSDGWSMGILVKEATELYEAHCEGRPSRLPALKIQYADYAAWQREWLKGEVLEEQLGYWRERLSGAPALLELPTDRPRPTTQRFCGETRTRLLPLALRDAMARLCRREGATLFMGLAAAFDVLLRNYTGRDDIVMGTNVANRNRHETEGLIGFFVNQLVLRTDLGGNPTFLELLGRVRETTLGAYAHQDLPFDVLVAELRPERSADRSPLYQVLFTLHNTPMGPVALRGLTITPADPPSESAKFDLVLALNETDEGLLESIEYNVDLFDRDTIDQMLEEYEAAATHAAARPEDRIGAIDEVLAAQREERRRVRNRDLRMLSSEKLKQVRRRQVMS